MSVKLISAIAGAGLLSLSPTLASAASIFGSLGNFDAVNDTGSVAHGFEIDLEGTHDINVTDTFGGAGRGFPTTVERYGSPTITNYNNGTTFGVKVVYLADLTGASSGWVGTPTGVYNTPGESCWTGGNSGYGPGTPCDHFGVGLNANPTKTTYSWLVESTPGSSTLLNATSNVLAPTWTVTPQPPAPGNPAPPPIVAAKIEAPDPVGMDFGEALWVKVTTTELDHAIGLDNLVGNDPNVLAAEAKPPEVEWQLLQKEAGNPASGLLENGDAAAVGAAAEAVLRRYEFYKFDGTYDPDTHEALFAPGFGDSNPGPGDVGNYIGAQNAALNFIGAPVAVPEPATWAMMLIGLGGIGALARARRRQAAILA